MPSKGPSKRVVAALHRLRTAGDPDPNWADRAACVAEDPEIFFPELGEIDYSQSLMIARGICDGCPVSVDCLRDALKRRRGEGVRGGLTHTDRKNLLKLAESLSVDLSVPAEES